MLPNQSQYRETIRRGTDWVLAHQNPDGSFIQPDLQADVYHKQTYALPLAGHAVEANRLLGWIKTNDLQADGDLRHFDNGLGLYKTSWICQGAHRLARFDLSRRVFDHILRCQAPCGGFFQVKTGNEYVEPVCSAWAAMAAIYTGHLDAATKAAGCLISMLEQQPDPGRFYYWMTPEGRLVTEESPLPGGAPFVDATQARQAYYCPGIAFLFLTRLHLATGCDECLKAAGRLFEFCLSCAEDSFSYPTAGKGAVAAAVYYSLTGDERARRAALRFADFLVEEQRPEGWWCNPYDEGMITRLDHTSEFIVWMTEIVSTLSAVC